MAKVELLKCGKIAEKYILQLNDFYQDISVEKYVIMPDHIHILLRVLDAEVGGASRTSPPTRQHSKVTTFVSTFKRFLTKSLEKTFGNDLFTTTLFEIQRIIKNISITLSKIQCDGIINIRKKSRKAELCYNIPTAYFVTICTEQKQPILSNIVGGDVLDAPQSDDVNVAKVEFLKYGKIADKNGSPCGEPFLSFILILPLRKRYSTSKF